MVPIKINYNISNQKIPIKLVNTLKYGYIECIVYNTQGMSDCEERPWCRCGLIIIIYFLVDASKKIYDAIGGFYILTPDACM